MLVPKDNGKFRLVIDLRPLNSVTRTINYPIPNILESLKHVAQHYWFAEIDIEDAFYHMKLHPDDRHLTAFDTPWGPFEFKSMPQGFVNAPAFWQHFIRTVLRPYWLKSCISYIDNVIIFAQNKEECHYLCRKIKHTLVQAGLKINNAKSTGPNTSLRTLGHVISHDKITPAKPKQTILDWAPPKTKLGLQEFLGSIEPWRPFVPNLAHALRPLQRQLSKDAPSWDTDSLGHFRTAKNLVHSSQSLCSIHTNGTVSLHVDASDSSTGGVLKEKERIHYITSTKLTEVETRYSTTDRELLAIVHATDAWSHFLLGQHRILLSTDHMALVQSLSPSDSNHRRNRWLMKLSNYNFSLEHVPGRLNLADLPSRIRK
jgi:hypothetical protein